MCKKSKKVDNDLFQYDRDMEKRTCSKPERREAEQEIINWQQIFK